MFSVVHRAFRTTSPFVFVLTISSWWLNHACSSEPHAIKTGTTLGSVLRHTTEADDILPRDSQMEILAVGFDFSEGPVWMPKRKMLLFSDIPRNTIYQWKDTTGLQVFLRPSGYTAVTPRDGEPGANGLLRDLEGRLILMEHGDRRVTRLDDPRRAIKTVLAERFEGKRLNSPNDGVMKSNGDLYFTDPPYGLEDLDTDPAKELDFQGVYLLTAGGQLKLLTRDLTRPNGIGLSPDERTLYIANSDPDRALWMAYNVKPDGTLTGGRVFQDFTAAFKNGKQGLPDGMTIDSTGLIYATGPGGVLIFSPGGKHIATLATGGETGNCVFGGDGSDLYITAHQYLVKIRLNTKGLGY